jgi:hypothetical protein
MGNLKITPMNVVTVGVIAFASVWLINRALTMANKSAYKA